MARQMTEQELVEFYEINRQLKVSHASKGAHSDARRFNDFMREIEKHLYRYADGVMTSASGSDTTEQL